jgi:hypothetical protein
MMELDELYVVARGVLLDALGALGSHRDAIVLARRSLAICSARSPADETKPQFEVSVRVSERALCPCFPRKNGRSGGDRRGRELTETVLSDFDAAR